MACQVAAFQNYARACASHLQGVQETAINMTSQRKIKHAAVWTFILFVVAATVYGVTFYKNRAYSGRATNKLPQILVNNNESAPTDWATTGTFLGIAGSSSEPLAFDMHVNGGASIVSIDSHGKVKYGPGFTADTASKKFYELIADQIKREKCNGDALHKVR